MLLQYNYVFDRAAGNEQLNNYTWSQWVNTTSHRKATRWRRAPIVRCLRR